MPVRAEGNVINTMEEEKTPICAAFASAYIYIYIYNTSLASLFGLPSMPYACSLCPLIPLASFVLISFCSWRGVFWNESLKVYKTL